MRRIGGSVVLGHFGVDPQLIAGRQGSSYPARFPLSRFRRLCLLDNVIRDTTPLRPKYLLRKAMYWWDQRVRFSVRSMGHGLSGIRSKVLS